MAAVNEVAMQSARLLLDAVERRGLVPEQLWSELPVSVHRLRNGTDRLDWRTWVAMMDRAAALSPVSMDELFVPGAGRRIGHPFVRIAQGLLSVRDIYAWLARWGVPRAFMNHRARFQSLDGSLGRFTMTIDPTSPGCLPSLQFFVGVLRHVPMLQGYSPSRITVETSTPHHAAYLIELPVERSFLGRARRLISVFHGMSTTLEELSHQANEIALKNKALEAQLAATRQRDEWLEVAIDAGRIGLWRWDPANRSVRISGRLLDWLGTGGRSEIETSIWTARIHLDDREHIAQVMANALRMAEPFETQYRITSPTGQLIWLHLNGRTHTDARGRTQAYGSATDITHEKLMESRMRMADRLISAGTLAAGVAHEVNNPLTYVLGSVELMQRRLAPHPAAADATKELMAQMIDGIDRIRSVVADVRSFARQDDNASGPVDPRVVCTSAIRIVATDVRHRAVVTTELADDTPCVSANASKLGQVVINLLVNAVQAMPNGRAIGENKIVVRTRALPSGEAAIVVEDNGSGIAAEVLPRLFDPFFTTKPIGLGTGLGLAVCEGIVASIGGRIDVASEVGRGSTFSVIVPAMAPTATRVVAPAPSIPVTPTNAHVLVIDDEPLIRDVVVRTLVSHGYHVDEAQSGREGLDRALAGDGRQVILCDLMMPDLDGAMLFEELLQQRPELRSRVVFISGGAVTERMRAFIERPDVVVIHKPFAIERLVAAIERAAIA
jgi:PAS domain S-box-containing protein